MKELLKDDEKQKYVVENAIADSEKARRFLLSIRNGASTHFGGTIDARIFHKQGFIYMNSLTENYNTLNDYAITLQKDATSTKSRDGVITTMTIGIIANIAIAIFLGYFFTTKFARRVSVVGNNALLLASGNKAAYDVHA